ncbi:DUF4432 family protein [Paenibacillus eucommiae]|uniref:Galactose mutarotase-like enzyme n=1 Tax=Paenibacillus eucommiae TaxID=1355755 RepID=A0ABS4J9R9_9BACL|nr:DUF4432 family protein [Paenibacillus eucommiae]MBP1996588.1 galactose mutarotase-like enzyme [Paenibacillus eucommiae]
MVENSKSAEARSTGKAQLLQHEIQGHRVLTLENEAIRVSIDVDHGAHIFEIRDKRTDIDVLYKDPKGLVYDVGGWYELFPNAGSGCSYKNTDIPGHGDVQYQSWEFRIEQDGDEEIRLFLWTESKVLPFLISKSIVFRSNESSLFISEKITNKSGEAEPYLWGQHITFGAPFVSPATRIDLPECRVFDRLEDHAADSRVLPGASGTLDSIQGKQGEMLDLTYFPADPFSEMLFIDEIKEYWYNVFNEQEGLGFALAWDNKAFPFLWLWQEHHTIQEAPFNGKVYSMALEPQASNVPTLSNAVEQGEAPVLQPGESLETWMTFVIHNTSDKVKFVSKEGQVRI